MIMKDNKLTDKEMELVRTKNNISAPGTILNSTAASPMNNDASCIYDNQNHDVGSTIVNEDGREYVCTSDGTWQVKEKK